MGSAASGHRRPEARAPVAQLDRAPDYESGGQEFESLRARHKTPSKVNDLLKKTLPIHVAPVVLGLSDFPIDLPAISKLSPLVRATWMRQGCDMKCRKLRGAADLCRLSRGATVNPEAMPDVSRILHSAQTGRYGFERVAETTPFGRATPERAAAGHPNGCCATHRPTPPPVAEQTPGLCLPGGPPEEGGG